MPKTFAGLLWHSFVKMNGTVLALIGLLASIILWVWKPEASVPLAVVVPSGIVFTLAIIVAVDAGYSAWLLKREGLPKVIYASSSSPSVPDVKLVCLLERSDLFSYGVRVGFYYQNTDSFESLIGVGRVINIQDDQRVQAGLTQVLEGQSETVELIRGNSKSVLERVRVKPTVPHDILPPAAEEKDL